MLSGRVGKKLFNFRLIAALAAAMTAGILFGAVAAYFAIGWPYLLIPFALASAALLICALKFKNTSLTVCFILIIAAFMLGAFSAYLFLASFAANEIPACQTVLVEGRVEKVGITSGGRTYLVISSARADGKSLGGKVIAYLTENAGDYCEKGYTVKFYAALTKQNAFEGGEISYYAQNSIKYSCNVYGGLEARWGFSLFGSANAAIRNTLFDNLDGETASVCYAMLTGDTSFISEGTLASFRGGGIAHLFAVSGLHIGAIFGALTLLFKRLPVNRYISAAIRVAAILLYAGVCNFTPSSIRATVMCAVMLCASLLHKKNDTLNSLSLAALILLIINPMYLFGAGFLLSFGAVLGIIMLGHNLEYILRALPKRVREPLSVGLAVHVSTVPTQLACFGYVSWAGLLLNLLIIPIITVLYLLLFFATVLAMIIPPAAGALVGVASSPIQLLVNAAVEGGLESAVISLPAKLWIYPPFALLIAGVSDKFNFKPVLRSALCSLALIGLTIVFLVS